MKARYLVLLFPLMLTLAACGSLPQPTAEPAPGTPAQPTPGESPLPEPGASPLSPLPTRPSPLPTPSADPVAAAAVTYLAAELDLPAEQVTLLHSEPVQWRDTSLGCPQPGMMYAQVIVPGYRLLLRAEGREYEAHTDQTGNKILICQSSIGE